MVPVGSERREQSRGSFPASLPPRTQTGTCQVTADDPCVPAGSMRVCDSASRGFSPLQSSEAPINGTPAWSRNDENAAATPGKLAAWMADRKSFDVAVP